MAAPGGVGGKSGLRLLHFGPIAGTVAHHGFELAAGVGLVFQPYLGLAGASAAWGTAVPAWSALAAWGRHRRTGDVLAVLAGTSLAGAVVHFVLWPVVRRPEGRCWGIPVLGEAEGLGPRQLPVYNAILYAWGMSSIVAIVVGTPRGSRRWALTGFAMAVPFRASARHHFEWLGRQAADRPAWWNRTGIARSGAAR